MRKSNKNISISSKYPVGSCLKFNGGNFNGLSGIITDVDDNSTHRSAIYGWLITVKLSNGKIGYVEKTEHINK